MTTKYPKGSEWRKWDLQVQTYVDPRWVWPPDYPDQEDQRRKKFNADLIQHCIDNDIKAIAITDHNSGEAIDGLLVKNTEIDEPISILPGVEIISSEGIHILAIFNPVTGRGVNNRWNTWEETIRQFLTAINMPQPAFHGEGNMTPATANETAENIIKKIEQFDGITIFPHANSTNGGLFCKSDSRTRKRLLESSTILDAAVEMDDVATRIQALEQKLRDHQFDPEGFSFINTSDSRKVADIGVKFTWIKSDPTFEGLRQIMFEPKERATIQKNDPTPIKSNYSIDGISISEAKVSDELTIKTTSLDLNHSLVAVVGGKGAGKTALVDIVANCYTNRCGAEDGNSFVRRIVDQIPELQAELKFKDGSVFSKKLSEQRFVEEGQFVYISQGELETYIGDKSDLGQYIKNLIFESPLVKDTAKSFDFLDSKAKVVDIEEKIAAKNSAIEKLEQKTGTEAAKELEKEMKQNAAELRDIEKRIKEFEKAQSKENIKVAEEKQEAINNLKGQRDDCIALRDLIAQSLNFLDEEVSEFNESIAEVNELLKKLKIKDQYKELSYPQRGEIESRLESTKKEITKTIVAIEKAQKDMDRFEQGVKKHAKLLERKREVEIKGEKLKEKNMKLNEGKKLLEQARKDREALMQNLFETILLQKKKYEEIIKAFSSDKDKVLSDLDFVAEVHFDYESFLEKADGIVDKRSVNIDGKKDKKGDPIFEELIQQSFAVARGDKNKIGDLLREMGRLEQLLKAKLKGSPVTVEDFYNLLYGNYMSVTAIVLYKKTGLEKQSLGQKATVLIKIYLAQGDKPIIIDSHDDHLDNEFIMDELVNAIRQAKNYRQIILVSNNGNVVVNSDAEQIVVATRNDEGTISYNAGSIEEPTIREKAIKVLEGGSEAFKKRQRKYRIKSS